MNELIFSLIFFLIIGVIFLKYFSNKIILLYVLLLPFRFYLFSFNGIEIRITDFLAIIIIVSFFSQRVFFPTKFHFNNNFYSNFILVFIIAILLSFTFNFFNFGYLGNLVDLIRIMFVLLISYSVFFSLNNKLFNQILFLWTLSASIASIAAILNLYTLGYNIGIFLSINDLSIQEFYFLKFSSSLFFEDPNNFASYLLISLFVSLHLMFYKNRLFGFSTFLILLGILISLSRSAYLSIVFSALFFLLYYVFFIKRFIFLKTIFFVFALIFSYLYLFNTVEDTSALSRIELWGVGLRMFFDNFILGVGIGNSRFLFSNYVMSDLLIFNPYFHNLYINIAAELGIFSLILFSLVIIINIKIDFEKTNFYSHLLFMGVVSFLLQSTAVEYFPSRHFWFFLALISFANLKLSRNIYE